MSDTRRINFDYAGASPLLPQVRQAMSAWLAEFGNLTVTWSRVK